MSMKQHIQQACGIEFSAADANNNENAVGQIELQESAPVNLDTILPLVKKPGQYIGGELNSIQKKWESVALRFCLVFPDRYEIGMSHLGLQIL